MIGVSKGATKEAEGLVYDYYHYMAVQHINEMAKGNAGSDVIRQMIDEPTYSRFIVVVNTGSDT